MSVNDWENFTHYKHKVERSSLEEERVGKGKGGDRKRGIREIEGRKGGRAKGKLEGKERERARNNGRECV